MKIERELRAPFTTTATSRQHRNDDNDVLRDVGHQQQDVLSGEDPRFRSLRSSVLLKIVKVENARDSRAQFVQDSAIQYKSKRPE